MVPIVAISAKYYEYPLLQMITSQEININFTGYFNLYIANIHYINTIYH